jgi:nucleoside-diphosphate-sugar epimerase
MLLLTLLYNFDYYSQYCISQIQETFYCKSESILLESYRMERILVTGALGQLGTELVAELQLKYGIENVVFTDIHSPLNDEIDGEFHILDVLDRKALIRLTENYSITQIYHLAAILSANAEKTPGLAWKINMDGLLNVLEVAKSQNIEKVFWPSSIAVFGPDTPKNNTPQNTIMNPNTIYGVTKVAGEKLCAYYSEKYDMDIRSLRYPGLIGHQSLPGGGTTDYAVEIFHDALNTGTFTCPLASDSMLPMMFMPDAVRATIELMEADRNDLSVNTSYNLAGINFTPEEIAESIRKSIPNFTIDYRPDFREKIAESWPNSIDDSVARKDWKWKVAYHLDDMTKEMLSHLKIKQQTAKVY